MTNDHASVRGYGDTACMKASSLRDMAVVSMTDGSKVGSIRDVLFDISQRQTRAFALSGTNGESVLLFTDVRTIGADAVVVEQASKVQGAAGQSSLDGLRSLSELTNLKVVSGDGSLLGQIQEVESEPADGRMTELTVLDDHRPRRIDSRLWRRTCHGANERRAGEAGGQRMRTFAS